MANPSSSHHRERERERHHHHRTISSTTLLLVLSLILAVLAVMLSLPSARANRAPATEAPGDNASGIWTYLTPRRSQTLVAREHDVALREAEVAKREAELLAGSVAGLPIPTNLPLCAPCQTIISTASPPATETIIKEVVREVETIGPGRSPLELRLEDVMQREEKVSDREKEVGKREEIIGRRETDASRRENWIMEQLIALGNDPAPVTVETEEFVYDKPRNRKISSKTIIEGTSIFSTTTVALRPAQTRLAAEPAPEDFVKSGKFVPGSAATTAVEVTVVEEVGEEQPATIERTVTVTERPRPTRVVPRRSFWNW